MLIIRWEQPASLLYPYVLSRVNMNKQCDLLSVCGLLGKKIAIRLKPREPKTNRHRLWKA